MDIGNIDKIANRKRMKVEVERLREKVSRGTAKIIKLKNINCFKEEIEKLNEQMQQINNEKYKIKSELDKNVEESKMKSVCIDELMTNIEALVKNIEEIQNTYKRFKVTSEEKIKELSDIIEARDKELDSKASSIVQLMSELNTSTDIRWKLETTLQNIRKGIDIERDGVKENERKMNGKIEQLEAVVRDKEDGLSKQMSIILEMKNENERLQDKMQGMQNMIGNVQKELTGRTAPAPRLQPEQDDNAVMLTPGPKKTQPPTSIIIQNSQFAVPRKDPKLDSMFFNMFSDSSMEEDTLDASDVNRLFLAMSRGEHVSPMPLGSLKRRSGVPIHSASGASKVKPAQHCDAISLPQVKNDIKIRSEASSRTREEIIRTRRLNNLLS